MSIRHGADGPVSSSDNDAPLFAPMPAIEIPKKRGHVPIAETSRAARPNASKAEAQRGRVLEEIGSRKTCTIDELAAAWDTQPNAVSGRFTELLAAGLIERTGSRRPTRTGAMAAVVRLTAAGELYLANRRGKA